MVVSSRATGIIVATGSETEITAAIGVISVLIFAYGKWVKGMAFVELFQAVVGIAVSLIPERLPTLITITLAIACQV